MDDRIPSSPAKLVGKRLLQMIARRHRYDWNLPDEKTKRLTVVIAVVSGCSSETTLLRDSCRVFPSSSVIDVVQSILL